MCGEENDECKEEIFLGLERWRYKHEGVSIRRIAKRWLRLAFRDLQRIDDNIQINNHHYLIKKPVRFYRKIICKKPKSNLDIVSASALIKNAGGYRVCVKSE